MTTHPFPSRTPALTALCLALVVAPLAAQTSDRASLGVLGAQGDDISFNPSLSADGRFVVWETGASSFIPGDSNANRDILVRDTLLGSTAVISLNSAGEQSTAPTGNHAPDISSDGRYVAFHSYAPNFDALGDTTGVSDVFLRDRDPDGDGLYDESNATTTRVSLDLAGGQPNAGSFTPKISGDGSVVAFVSGASDLVAAGVSGSSVFARDLVTGVNELVSRTPGGLPRHGSLTDISRDGRYVTYWSSASDIVPGDTNGMEDVFVYDRVTATTVRVSVDSSGAEGSSWSARATLSADGRYVAFFSKAQLVADDVDFAGDIYLHDRDPDENGVFDEANGTTVLVNRNSFGVITEGAIGESYPPFVSDDGRWVAFSGGDSSGSCCDLVVEDNDGAFDVFLRDMHAGITTRVSVTDDGLALGSKAWAPSLSADGAVIAFSTGAPLDADDTNTHEDVYVHDRRVWADIGWNMAGSLASFPFPVKKGSPTLTGAGTLEPGSTGAMTLSRTTKGAVSYALLGLSQIDASFKLGVLVPAPDYFVGPIAVSAPPTEAYGGWSLPFTWPVGVPSGTEFFAQVWVVDAAGPVGLVSSNGLRGTAP